MVLDERTADRLQPGDRLWLGGIIARFDHWGPNLAADWSRLALTADGRAIGWFHHDTMVEVIV